MKELKYMIQPGMKVHFQKYQHGILTYATDNGFVFRVPISDVGEGACLVEDSAMLYMRWIKKELLAL